MNDAVTGPVMDWQAKLKSSVEAEAGDAMATPESKSNSEADLKIFTSVSNGTRKD